MKDIPHHMKKLNRKIVRSMHREEEALPEIPSWKDSAKAIKEKAKRQTQATRHAHIPLGKTPEERNQEMKRGLVPIFDRNNALPRHSRPSHKKKPRI